MAKATKKTAENRVEILTVWCFCLQDQEMICKTPPATNGYRKFYCSVCRSTLWLSPKAFEQADEDGKIMQAD